MVLVVACRAPAPDFHAQRGDLAITDTNVVDVVAGRTLPDQTVVVRGAQIVAVAPAASIDPGDADIVDGRGKHVMPGLVDMHVHLYAENDLVMLASAGVTTVRNMAGGPAHLEWRTKIASGDMFGPTIVTAGPILDGGAPNRDNVVVTSPAEADAAVVDQKAAGYDFIKVHEGLRREVYDAIAMAARREHIAFAGHAPGTIPLAHVLEQRQRSIEHLTGYPRAILRDDTKLPRDVDMVTFARAIAANLDDRKLAAIAADTARAGTWNCPTLVVSHAFARLDSPTLERDTRWLDYVDKHVRAGWAARRDVQAKDAPYKRVEYTILERILAAIVHAGGKLLVGTDEGNAYVVAGASLHDELELLVAAGVPRAAVLRAATADASVYLETPGLGGVVAASARADLIVADTDPLAGPIAIPPAAVLLAGRYYDRAALTAKLAALR